MFWRGADDKSVWIRETRRCVECRLEIADTEDRESDAIRKDEVGGGREVQNDLNYDRRSLKSRFNSLLRKWFLYCTCLSVSDYVSLSLHFGSLPTSFSLPYTLTHSPTLSSSIYLCIPLSLSTYFCFFYKCYFLNTLLPSVKLFRSCSISDKIRVIIFPQTNKYENSFVTFGFHSNSISLQ